MRVISAKLVFAAVLGFLLTSSCLVAQESTSTLSGTITDAGGKALANVKVSVKNVASGQSSEIQTDVNGRYSLEGLAAGDYEVTAALEGIGSVVAKITLTAGAPQTLALILAAPSAEGLPNAPSPKPAEPSLEDLGFSKADTQAITHWFRERRNFPLAGGSI
ncbi:MAG TPA: carboxypeptidase-like regulatory domain-containing protein [Candidatus Acidoferrum sp.]